MTSSRFQTAVPVCPLRSSDTPLLNVQRTRTEFARQSFSVVVVVVVVVDDDDDDAVTYYYYHHRHHRHHYVMRTWRAQR